MPFLKALDISGSGLTAQRLRMDLISSNIANINTTRTGESTPAGNQVPYSRLIPIFEPRSADSFGSILKSELGENGVGDGVKVSAVVKDQAPFKEVYNPDSPDAVTQPEAGLQQGYVRMPNVDLVNEMVDIMSASRAYEANVTAVNAGKGLVLKALEIGKG